MSGPRLAGVFPLTLEPIHMGKEAGLIPLGLGRLGWQIEMHAPVARGHDWPMPVRTAPLARLADPDYWSGRELDGAVVVTFLSYGRIVRALRIAGVPVVAKADTDGLVSPRVFPRESLVESFWHHGGPVWRARSLASWIARAGPLHRAHMRVLEDLVRDSTAFTVESDPARERIVHLLTRYADPALAERVHTIPSPVTPLFSRRPVRAERDRLVVAVGRWTDPQKHPRLMARALKRFLTERDDYRAVLIGSGGERHFADRHGGRLEVRASAPQEEIASLLDRARIVVSSSRWESFSLATHEGLACGCSVAATRLAPFLHMEAVGGPVTLTRGRGAAALADAIATEAAAWDEGRRDPRRTAELWRHRLDIEVVAGRYDTLLPGAEARRAGRAGRVRA